MILWGVVPNGRGHHSLFCLGRASIQPITVMSNRNTDTYSRRRQIDESMPLGFNQTLDSNTSSEDGDEMNVDAEVVVDRILHAKDGHLQSEFLRAELEAASNEIGSMIQEIKRKCEERCGDREAFFVTKFVIGDEVASLAAEQPLEVDGPIQKAGDIPVIIGGERVNQTQVLISSRPRLLAVHAEYKGPDGSGKVLVSREFEFDMDDDETVLMELGKDL